MKMKVGSKLAAESVHSLKSSSTLQQIRLYVIGLDCPDPRVSASPRLRVSKAPRWP